MKIKYFITSVLLIISVSAAASDISSVRRLNADLIVTDRKSAAEKFVEWAESNGGYYLRYSDSGVILRIADYNDEEINTLLRKSGEIISYTFNSENPEKEISIIKGRIDARDKLLSDYYSLLNNSDFKSTLALEKEISSVLREIEQLKGRLKKLEHDKKYAYAEINFFSEEISPGNEISSFDWINSVDFYLLMEEEAAVE